jgi:transcriptional regulator with XRE-family HTH domain
MKHETGFEVTGAELRAARNELRWTIQRLATESGIHRSTIAKIEAGRSGWPEIIAGLRQSLESAGAIFAVRSARSSAALTTGPYQDARGNV